MPKELIIAVAMGFIIGFAVAGGVFYLPKINTKKTNDVPTVLNEGKTAPSQKEQILDVTVPEDFQEIADTKTDVKGKTQPNSTIVINTPDQDYVVRSDLSGNYEQNIALKPGTQEIAITAYLPNGESDTVKHTIVALPAE